MVGDVRATQGMLALRVRVRAARVLPPVAPKKVIAKGVVVVVDMVEGAL